MKTKILYEHEVNNDVNTLYEAWANDPTFAFVPDKSGVSFEWLKTALTGLQKPLQKNHFALLTSGSTGQPKLIVGSRERAEKLAQVLHKIQDSSTVDQTIVVLPLTYCYAFVNQWLWAWKLNRPIIFTEGFSKPDKLKEVLNQSSNCMVCLIGAQIQFFIQHFAETVFPGVTRLHFAGGGFPKAKLPEIRTFFPNAKIYNNYGCAEAMPRLAVRQVIEDDNDIDIGFPLPGVELKTEKDGELFFRSPYASVAYIDSDGHHKVENTTWISTGDLAEQKENGNWCIVGRKNEVFKRYGEKIALPQLLTTVSKQWPGQAAFYREKDNSGEEAHVLVLSPKPSDSQLRTILKAFRLNHTRIHWPLRIESTRNLPFLANGKIDQVALSKLDNTQVLWRQRT